MKYYEWINNIIIKIKYIIFYWKWLNVHMWRITADRNTIIPPSTPYTIRKPIPTPPELTTKPPKPPARTPTIHTTPPTQEPQKGVKIKPGGYIFIFLLFK